MVASALDRSEMDDHAGTAVEHAGQQRPVQPHRRQQVQVQRALPCAVVQHREAAGRGLRAAEDMDEDVDAAEPVTHRFGHGAAAPGLGQVCGHERLGLVEIGRPAAGDGEDAGPGPPQPCRHRGADAAAAAGHQGALAGELARIGRKDGAHGHPWISSVAIRPSFRPKT
jgi:hypothetical protein